MSDRSLPLLVVLLCVLARCTSADWVQKGGTCTSAKRSFDCPYYNSDNTTFPFEVRLFNTTVEPRVFMACDHTWDNDLLKVVNFTSSVVRTYMDGANSANETLPMQIPRLSTIDNRRPHLWDVETCHLVGRGVRSLPVPNDQFVHLLTLDTNNAFAIFPFTNQTTAGVNAKIAEVKAFLDTKFPDLEYDSYLTWAGYSTDGFPSGQTDEIWVTLVWPQHWITQRGPVTTVE